MESVFCTSLSDSAFPYSSACRLKALARFNSWHVPIINPIKITTMTLTKYIADFLETNVVEEEIVRSWSEYCQDRHYYDNEIFYMSEIDDLISTDGKSVTEFFEMFDKNFDLSHDFFSFDGYGYIYSCGSITDTDFFDYSELAEYVKSAGLDYIDISEAVEEFFDEEVKLEGVQSDIWQNFRKEFSDWCSHYGKLSDIDDAEDVVEIFKEFLDAEDHQEDLGLFEQ